MLESILLFAQFVWSHLKSGKDAFQALAFIAAFVYFIYRVINGYLIVNTSIGIELVRSAIDAATDGVAITVNLERGQLGTLVLHDLQARVLWTGGDHTVSFDQTHRLSYVRTHEPVDRKRACFDKLSTRSPLLRLAPGEKAAYSMWVEIPASAPCYVNAVALGRLMGGWKMGQWRASKVALPRPFIFQPVPTTEKIAGTLAEPVTK